jgi:hypothetical protein
MATEPTTITLPLGLGVKTTKARTTILTEVKADGAKHLGAMLTLDNAVLEQLGASDLTITITATWSEPTFKLPAPEAPKPAPKPKATAKPKADAKATR